MAKELKLAITCDNAAFYDEADNPDAGAECARLLRKVADRLAEGHEAGSILDSNGNRVGSWEVA